MKVKKTKTRSRTTPGASKKRAEMIRARLSGFARSLLREWRRLQLPAPAANAVVAVSGGADSVALLLALDELVKTKKLKLILTVAHIDHLLRKNVSAADARWVKALAESLGYHALIRRVDVGRLARQSGDNLEQAARVARYQSLAATAQKLHANVVLTAHTMDDQAETVLLNLMRGSGSDGLSGIEPVRPLAEHGQTVLARPLLSWARRTDTERYCTEREARFRQDEMNRNDKFARVRVRRSLLPLMETFNPRIVAALVRTTELLRDDSAALEDAAGRLLELSNADAAGKGNQLRIDLLLSVRPALRRRALRLWLAKHRGDLRRLELVHIRAVENLLYGNRGGRRVELPGGATVSRSRGLLVFAGNARTSTTRKT
jgi:tRNA(Ile)-lysidine synthase